MEKRLMDRTRYRYHIGHKLRDYVCLELVLGTHNSFPHVKGNMRFRHDTGII